jgi:hypothetical protein
MARTTFSGPVRALAIKGATRALNQPLTPTTVNAGAVIPVDQGTGSLLVSMLRVECRLSALAQATFQTPGEALCRVWTSSNWRTVCDSFPLRPISTTWRV